MLRFTKKERGISKLSSFSVFIIIDKLSKCESNFIERFFYFILFQ